MKFAIVNKNAWVESSLLKDLRDSILLSHRLVSKRCEKELFNMRLDPKKSISKVPARNDSFLYERKQVVLIPKLKK